MKIAVITDLHIGCRNDNQHLDTFFLKFFTEQFIPYLVEHDIKTVLVGGDVFDKRQKINIDTFLRWKKEVFDLFYQKGINLLIIAGNHDVYYRDTNSVNSLEFLSSYENVLIYTEEPRIYCVDSTRFLLVPWIPQGQEERFVKAIKKSQCDYCLGHFDIVGFKMTSGHSSTHGLDTKLFKKFKGVWSGHYHLKQQSGNILYLGSPYPMTWDDYGTERGFHVFDTDTQDLEFIPNRLELFKKIQYTEKTKVEDVTGKFVRVVVDDRGSDKKYKKFLKEIAEQSTADVSVQENYAEVNLPDNLDAEEMSQRSTLQLMKEYVDETEIPVSKEEVFSLLQDVYYRANMAS